MKRGTQISDYLQPLQPNQTQCYLTDTLQVADIIEWVLGQVGRSEIWQTTFSISEEFLRRLYFIEKSGRVERIHLVLDFKATQKTLRLWAFITQVIENTYLADNHSKVVLIRGSVSSPPSNSASGLSVAIITSQNLTRGNRNESTIVTTDEAVFATLHESVTELIRSRSVPLSELFKAQAERR